MGEEEIECDKMIYFLPLRCLQSCHAMFIMLIFFLSDVPVGENLKQRRLLLFYIIVLI